MLRFGVVWCACACALRWLCVCVCCGVCGVLFFLCVHVVLCVVVYMWCVVVYMCACGAVVRVVWCGVVCEAWHAENPLCVRSKRLRANGQDVSVCTGNGHACRTLPSSSPLHSLLPSLPLLLLKKSRDLLITVIFPARNLFLLQFYINSKKSPPGEITGVTVLY